MDRTMGSERPGTRASARPQRPARAPRRPDLALLVAVAGLILGGVVLASLLRGIVPAPPSSSAPEGAATAPPAGGPGAAAQQSGGPGRAAEQTGVGAASGVAGGVAYSALSVERVDRLTLPGSGGTLRGDLVIVKLLVRGVAATPTTASAGFVELTDGEHTYQPLLSVAAALSQTLWHALERERLAPGESSRVKLFYELRTPARAGLGLVLTGDSGTTERLAIPAVPTT